MEDKLNHAPCGYLSLSDDGTVLDINETLLTLLGYQLHEVVNNHINKVLTVPTRLFYQIYFFPLIKMDRKVEEMYLSLCSKSEKDIPVLLNAVRRERLGQSINECVFIPIQKRNEYENEILHAKKTAEEALVARAKANEDLKKALGKLKANQKELLELYKQNQQYQAHIQNELHLAKKIQEKSLTTPFTDESLNIATYYKPSNELSGDMYMFYKIDKNQYGFIILDVMGHGISSALISMSLRALVQKLDLKELTVAAVMKELDEHLHSLFYNNNKNDIKHYCTGIYFFIDTAKQEINYINSGHPAAIWQDANGKLYELRSTSPPVGIFDDLHFEGRSFSYSKGGRLLLYTDGITDALGATKLREILAEHRFTPLEQLKGVIYELLKEEHLYSDRDDQCFILVDFL